MQAREKEAGYHRFRLHPGGGRARQGGKRILFSGDLGQGNRPILRDPADPSQADIVVMESTYGDRPHKQLETSIHELYDAIKKTFQHGGNVIIPSFALERSQEILYYLRQSADRQPGDDLPGTR